MEGIRMRLLIAEDDDTLNNSIQRALSKKGFQCTFAKSGEEALHKFILNPLEFDLVLSDLKMSKLDGLDLLKEIKTRNPMLPFILMTGHSSLESAVSALRGHATDYLVKPFSISDLEERIQSALLRSNSSSPSFSAPLSDDLAWKLVGTSASIVKVRGLIQKVAPTPSPVLILGESGTGKEIVAEEIHRRSSQRNKPFVVVHCAALSEGILESELFGHEKGSFTGAYAAKAGLLETAEDGTLFLDEIGEISPSIQVKLLRVLQKHEFQRVGGTKTLRFNARIIAATNRNLSEEVAQQRFREDFFYRLNVFEIVLPALRERREDLPLLIEDLLKNQRIKFNKKVEISVPAMESLKNYNWPGNVRELENTLERAIVLAEAEMIQKQDLPGRIFDNIAPQEAPGHLSECKGKLRLVEFEKEIIREALNRWEGNLSRAAKQLGMKRSTLQYRVHKLLPNFRGGMETST